MRKSPHTYARLDPLKDATLNALSQLLDPLIQLMFDTGVTVREFTRILRERSVLAANHRIFQDTEHPNKARISIMTGLPRSEVSRLLSADSSEEQAGRAQHPIRKVLAGWFDDAQFLTQGGEPSALPIFGRRRSFERLVQKYGGGVPVRAMLDELTRIDAIERLSNQSVRPRSRIPLMTGLTTASIELMGERGRDLLTTLTSNARHKCRPLFEATAVLDEPPPQGISFVRREIHQQGMNFIDNVDGLLQQIGPKNYKRGAKDARTHSRIGVTAYYFEDRIDQQPRGTENSVGRPRKNLRRKPSLGVNHRRNSPKDS